MDLIASILTVAAWGGASILLLLLFRIAHFYQMTAKQTTYSWLYFVPLVLLLLSGLRYAWVGGFAGDLVGDSLELAGGLILIGLGLSLLRMMTGGRQ